MADPAMMPTPPEPVISAGDRANLLQKLLAVMKDCGYIKKDKKNSFHGYTYASEAAIKQRLHESLLAHGLLFTTSAVEVSDRPVTVGKEQKTEFVTLVTIHFEFHDAETGASIGGQFYGSGVDGADKGVYKAYTGAIKYILTSWFLIPTGDDPEAEYERKRGKGKGFEEEPEGVQRNTPEQQKQFAQQRYAELRRHANQVTPVESPRPVGDAGTQRLIAIQNSFTPERFKSTVLPEFKRMKMTLTGLRGHEGETRYYSILKEFNAGKATDFDGRVPQAKLCYEELWKQVAEWEPKGE